MEPLSEVGHNCYSFSLYTRIALSECNKNKKIKVEFLLTSTVEIKMGPIIVFSKNKKYIIIVQMLSTEKAFKTTFSWDPVQPH